MSNAAAATPKTLRLKVENNVTIVVPNNIKTYATYVLLEQNDWFEDEIELVRKYLRPGMNAVDIGANHGFYALPMAQLVGEQGNIWAIEPNPKVFELLNESKKENRFHQLHNRCFALSDISGKAFLSDRGHDVLNQVFDRSPNESSMPIDTRTLDDLADEFAGHSIDFIKIDAEGHEQRIIKGGTEFFTRHSPLVMMEIRHEADFEYGGLDALLSLGYSAYLYIKPLGVLMPFTKGDPVENFTLNILCCKDDRAESLANEGLLSRPNVLSFFTPLTLNVSWKDRMSNFAYSRAHTTGWISSMELDAPNAWESYEQVLDLFYASADTQNISAGHRYRILEQAMVMLSKIFQQQVTLPRIFTAARIALQIGQRSTASRLMENAANILLKTQEFEIHEPFLPALPRYDDIEIGPSFKTWMLSCALEFLETIGYFTAFIGSQKNLGGLDYIIDAGFATPELLRRRALIRYRFGISDHIEYPMSPEVTAAEEPNFELWNAIKAGKIHLARDNEP